MTDLVEFLRARLDEDEQVARAAIADDGGQDGGFEDSYEQLTNGFFLPRFAEDAARMITTYAVPRRVLAEVEAKRRIVTEHTGRQVMIMSGDGQGRPGMYCTMCSPMSPRDRQRYPCLTVRLLALLYADHADYREEWRP